MTAWGTTRRGGGSGSTGTVDTLARTSASAAQADIDAAEVRLDSILAKPGTVIAVGGHVLALDDPRPYINNTGAPITLTGENSAGLLADGLELDVDEPASATDLQLFTASTLTPNFVPPGELTDAQVALTDRSHFANGTPTSGVTLSDGAITFSPDASAHSIYADIPAVTGEVYVSLTLDKTAGTSGATIRVQLTGGVTIEPDSRRNASGQHVIRFTGAAGQNRVRIIASAALGGVISDLQVHQMDAILARPTKIIYALGQSNGLEGSGYDSSLDRWAGLGSFYVPGFTTDAYGSQDSVIAALTGPMQWNGQSIYASPAIEVARTLYEQYGATHNICIVASNQGGAGLVDPGDPWADGGTAFDKSVTMAAAAKAAFPGGTEDIAVVYSGNEDDLRAAYATEWPGAFDDLRSRFQTAIGSGDLPWVLMNFPVQGVNVNQAIGIDTATKMDRDSGDALSRSWLTTIERPDLATSDGTHAIAEDQRITGKAVGESIVNLSLPTVTPTTTTELSRFVYKDGDRTTNISVNNNAATTSYNDPQAVTIPLNPVNVVTDVGGLASIDAANDTLVFNETGVFDVTVEIDAFDSGGNNASLFSLWWGDTVSESGSTGLYIATNLYGLVTVFLKDYSVTAGDVLDFRYGNISGENLSVRGVKIFVEEKSSSVELLSGDIPTNLAEVGTPLSATSTKDYVLQWSGAEIVNVLSYEYEAGLDGSFECNHLTGVLRQWGVSPNGDGPNAVPFGVNFADTSYSFVGSFTDDGTGNFAGPAASVGINWWTENLTTSSIDWDRDDDIDGLDLHWQAIGLKP